jgi:hypothetical protein
MSSPQASTAITRPDLNATLMEYDLDASRQGFIGMQLCPVVDVALQGATFKVIKVEQLLQEQDTRRAPDGSYGQSDYDFTEDTYITKEHGWKESIDDNWKAQFRNYFDAEAVAAQRTRDVVLRNQERRVIAAVLGATATAAAAAVWSNKSSATPVADVMIGLKAVRANCGMLPNTVAMDYDAYLSCIETDEVVDRLKYSGLDDPKNVGVKALAALFKVERVIVANAQRNSANQAQTRSLSPIFTKTKVLIAHCATDNDLQKPALGRTFHWSEDGSSVGGTMETYRDEDKRSDMVRCRMQTHEKKITDACGYVLTGVLA